MPKPPVTTESSYTHFIPLYSAKEDYWAAISGIESIWNPSDDSVLCQTRLNGCKCKQCKVQPAKLIVPPTPELWWDRSAGMELWPEIRNDDKVGANAQKHQTPNPRQPAACIILAADHSRSDHCDEKAENDAAAYTNIDGDIRKRRLLSVDWSSISTSNVDGHTMIRTDSNIEHNFKSITEIDSAILERGPLTTESFSMPLIMQPSMTGTLLTCAAPASENQPITVISGRMKGGGQHLHRGIQGYFQTAFTSNDICDSNALEHRTRSLADDGAETTLNLKSSVSRQSQKAVGEPHSSATGIQAPGSNERHASAAVPELKAKAVTGGESERVDNTVGAPNFAAEPDTTNSAVAVEGVLDKGKDDTDIPPDSIENASVEGRRKVTVEQRPNLRNDFKFPHSEQVFRARVDADSGTPYDNDSGLVTENKKIYDDSKPTPRATDDMPVATKMIRTEPSSPVNPKRLLSKKRSFSLNDLQKASDEPTETHRLDKKPPPVPVSDRAIPGKAVKNQPSSDCDPYNKATSNENEAKIAKPKRTWKQNATRTKYPTGIPLNSMLNDTIRRNFRQKATPVTIFGLYRPPDVSNANAVSVRPPSIDDWSEVMVRPVPVGAYCMQQPLASNDHGIQAARYDLALKPHYVPLPLVLYPSTSVPMSRMPDNPGRHRPRRQVVKRRNSFTTVQQVAATQARKSRFQQYGIAKSTAAKASGYAVGRAQPKLSLQKLKMSAESLDKPFSEVCAVSIAVYMLLVLTRILTR